MKEIMNIYEIKQGGESDWICAHTAIEALQKLAEITEVDIYDLEVSDDILCIPREVWKDMYITNENGKTKETFYNYMQTAVEPNIMCSTAY